MRRTVDFMNECHGIRVVEQQRLRYIIFVVKKDEWNLIVEAHFDHGICVQVKQGKYRSSNYYEVMALSKSSLIIRGGNRVSSYRINCRDFSSKWESLVSQPQKSPFGNNRRILKSDQESLAVSLHDAIAITSSLTQKKPFSTSKLAKTNKPTVPEVNEETIIFHTECALQKVLKIGDSKCIERTTCDILQANQTKAPKRPTFARRSSDNLEMRKYIAISFV